MYLLYLMIQNLLNLVQISIRISAIVVLHVTFSDAQGPCTSAHITVTCCATEKLMTDLKSTAKIASGYQDQMPSFLMI